MAKHGTRLAATIVQLLVLVLLVLVEARAQSSILPDAREAEAEIKAAFICKFGNYVEWPATEKGAAESPFVIGALTDETTARQLARAAAGRNVAGRPIVVRRIGRADRIDDLAVVFVSRSQSTMLAEAISALRRRPILIVTDADEAIAAGSMVNFVIVDDRVRFDIGLHAAEQSSLKISGRLLTLARKVSGGPP